MCSHAVTLYALLTPHILNTIDHNPSVYIIIISQSQTILIGSCALSVLYKKLLLKT